MADKKNEAARCRRDAILDDALRVFGRHGYRKTSVQDVAAAAGLSKPGLYLHFSGKDALFAAAIEKYLADALERVRVLLAQLDVAVERKLVAALDAWFGRHLVTFAPESFDVIDAGDRLSAGKVEGAKRTLKRLLAKALAELGFDARAAADRAEVLFLCGLCWKQPGMTPAKFRAAIATCARVCCEAAPPDLPRRRR